MTAVALALAAAAGLARAVQAAVMGASASAWVSSPLSFSGIVAFGLGFVLGAILSLHKSG